MGQQISGPGVGLPPPQNYYPSELYNAPQDPSSNVMTLAPGDAFHIPAGNFYVDMDQNLILQYKDPVTGNWQIPFAPYLAGTQFIKSDGFTTRIANLTGCPVAAVVTNAGSGYPATGTSVTASGSGGSTWQAIVGGLLSVNSITVAGSGYGVPPIVMIPPPPSPGVQATAHATITGGSVTAITLDNVGAGYIQNPVPVMLVPAPNDPNYIAGNTIVQAQASVVPIGAGSIAAVLCTNYGASTNSAPTLTIAGTGGANALATAVLMQTLVGATAYTLGAGYTTAVLETIGGVPSASPIWTNPVAEGRLFVPRPATELLTVSGGSIAAGAGAANGTIYDGGLFLGTPSVLVNAGAGALITASASVVPLLGSAAGTFRLQPAP